MSSAEWNYLTIGDCADIIGGGTPSTKKEEYWGGGIPWISPKDLSNNSDKYITRGERFITQSGLEKSSAKLLPSNSLLFSSRAPIGYLAINKNPVATNQGFKSLIPNKEHDVEFLYYLFKKNIEYIKSYASGSTFQEVSDSTIKNLSFHMPDLKEQKIISNTLSTFDKKIELNHKMNQTLEEIAKTLFKSWFIDFDPVRAKVERRPTGLSKEISDLFPDSFEDSEFGEIPKGWKVELFKNVVDEYVDNRGKTPPLVDIGIPLVEVKHMHDNSQFPDLNTDKHVSKDIFDSWFRKHVEKYDVLISTVGTIGLTTCVFNSNFAIAQNVLGLRFSTKSMSLYMFNLIKSNYFQHQMNSRLVETVQKSIKRKDLNEIPILVPSEKILIEFFNFASANLEKQFNNELQNATLSNLRDMLLPELISGQLKIPDAEKLAEKAGV